MKQQNNYNSHQAPTPTTLINNTNYHSTNTLVLNKDKNVPSSIRDYVYSSQSKTRDHYTLKNMLAMPGNQAYIPGGLTSPNQLNNQGSNGRNFQSQQSDRLYKSNSRPNTMYGQRVRLFLQDENKKSKMQTQIKIKRHQSSHLKRSSSRTSKQQNTQEQKLKMKKALGKINLLSEGVDMGCSEEEKLQTIFYFLECLAQINNHYQQAFVYITQKLKEYVFADKMSQFGGRVKKFVESNKNNQVLFNFVYRSLGKTSYQSLADQLIKTTQKSMEQLQEYKAKQEQGEQNYEIVIREKQDLIKKLKKQLKYYQQHPSQDLYPYIKRLEQQNGQMGAEIQQLVRIKDQYQYRISIYENTNMLLSQQIQTLKEKIYQFELQELSGMKEIEKNSELKQFQDNVSNLRAMMDKSKLKMQGMKEQFEKLKAYNEDLLNERSKLAKRAAVGFGELTPRPNMKNIFLQNNIIFEKYFPPLSRKQRSTQDMVKIVVQNLKFIPQQQQKKKRQTPKLSVAKQQQQDFGDNMMKETFEQIQKTQEQINKTSQAAEEVKKSYNRQQKERQNLEKTRK